MEHEIGFPAATLKQTDQTLHKKKIRQKDKARQDSFITFFAYNTVDRPGTAVAKANRGGPETIKINDIS